MSNFLYYIYRQIVKELRMCSQSELVTGCCTERVEGLHDEGG